MWSGETNFADIIKITITVVKTTFKNSIKVKGFINYVLKSNLYLSQYQKIATF